MENEKNGSKTIGRCGSFCPAEDLVIFICYNSIDLASAKIYSQKKSVIFFHGTYPCLSFSAVYQTCFSLYNSIKYQIFPVFYNSFSL